jgi:5-methylcytosine-specific restriction protein A
VRNQISKEAQKEIRREFLSIYKADVRRNFIEEHGNRCRNCGSLDNLTIDHIRPVCVGGGNEKSNLQVLCWSCNKEKGPYSEMDIPYALTDEALTFLQGDVLLQLKIADILGVSLLKMGSLIMINSTALMTYHSVLFISGAMNKHPLEITEYTDLTNIIVEKATKEP